MRTRVKAIRDDRGVSLIELLAAVFVFVLLFLMIDGVFSIARRSAAKAELGADVQQNARLSVERLIREIREGNPTAGDVVIGGTAGARAVVFRSARPKDNPAVFCVDTTLSPLYDAACFTAPGPVASPGDTFTPVWQSYVGYYLVAESGGGYSLRRYVGDLSSSTAALPSDPTVPPGDATVQTIGTFVASFDVTMSGNKITARLAATGQEQVQGSTIPAQQIVVEGTADLRNK